MPPKVLEKKGGLTLEKLATYDDVITDALVDKVYYWTTIRKNRGGRFCGSRGLHEEDIADIVRQHVVYDKDPAEAVQQLLRLSGLRKFVNSLREEREKDHFTRHLRKYVNIYLPDCPFEVTTTNRYTISEHEASITARKAITKGEEIKYLTGIQVTMTKEQEKTLELARKDFSLVISSRKKTRSLFLGPARFANHDCSPNARLSTKGYDGMQIVAVKNIEEGDEITVSYGDDYFGDDNEECLCFSCEQQLTNGWALFKKPEKDDDDDDEEEEEEETPAPEEQSHDDGRHSFRRKRRFDSTGADTVENSPSPKKIKQETPGPVQSHLLSPVMSPTKRRSVQPLRESTLKKAYSASSLSKEVPLTSIEDPVTNLAPSPQTSRTIRNQQRDGLLTVSLDEADSSRTTTPKSSVTVGSPESPQSTDATSVDDEASPSEDKSQVPAASSVTKPAINDRDSDLKPNLEITTVRKTTWALWDDTSSDLSELSANQDLDDDLQQIVTRKRPKALPIPRTTRSQSRYHIAGTRMLTPVEVGKAEEGYVENPRKQGDYTLTEALLSAKYSRWVECHNCDDHFVQADAYHTRKDCPRCERHSKVYGYAWPKTDKEGKHDTEERVRDHRTVHRFVDPEEERSLKKGRKALKEVLASRLSTPMSSVRESSMSAEPDSGKGRKRARVSMSTEAESGRNRKRLRQTM
ncbi:hypothetical protein EJ04DRAFT_515096 [Polyplosphaeria fusca]|uniref:Histone-lysine N-methyltransferase SET9 n=1 Tax=Polyplosphaeria fusca TaxID=682080 RepID=A0A9P4QQI8_9PLEO|nr:hypothetical protein EJ04DRAFT_515096 [Polyplosphaeria fusca]